jgi:hypothetical protein
LGVRCFASVWRRRRPPEADRRGEVTYGHRGPPPRPGADWRGLAIAVLTAFLAAVVGNLGHEIFGGNGIPLPEPPPLERVRDEVAGGDRDCGEFPTQAQAQAFFRSHGAARDPYGLDADDDEEACESLP